jgi:hypothetical protein
MLTPRKWNGDSRPFIKKGPIPKGDPRDTINAHNRAESKREVRKELRKLELEVSYEQNTLPQNSNLL